MTTLSPETDADLLARFLRCDDQRAFAALVQAHERLVIGTAARVTGNAEMARDVAQQVFTALAQKAWMLSDRASLAGWLHHAARHVALRMTRSEQARARRHERAAADEAHTRADDPWPVLEESLAALREAEREAVVMHYLEDRPYAEMAATLGVNETAVRKRVSRGLENLGGHLRQRGYRGAAAGLLAGAAAMQIGPAPVVIAAGAASFSLTPLTLTTLMTHTAAKLTAAACLCAAIPIVWQTHANSELRSELAALERQPRPTAAATVPGPDDTVLKAEAGALTDRLAAARRDHAEANSQLAAVRAKVRRLDEEVVVSYGKPEEIGRKLARKLGPLMEMQAAMEELQKAKRPPTAAEMERINQLMAGIPELAQMAKTVLNMEDRPPDAARMYTALFDEAFKLSDGVRAQLEGVLLASFEELRKAGLNASQRPKGDAERWEALRGAASEAMAATLASLLPPEARKQPLAEILDGGLGGPGILPDTFDLFAGDVKAAPRPAPAR